LETDNDDISYVRWHDEIILMKWQKASLMNAVPAVNTKQSNYYAGLKIAVSQ